MNHAILCWRLFQRTVCGKLKFVAGVGLDFSAATSVVFAELPQEVAHVRQAEDRAHRKGQTLPVNVYFLIARSTTDERRC